MLKRNLILFSFLLVSGLLILNSCKKDDDSETPIIKPDNRIFIVSEGPFQGGNGTLSIFYRDTEETEHGVFEAVNGFPLGNLAQSVSVHNDKVYIVVNNANRVEITAKDNLVSLGAIEGINLPRYFLGVDNNKAYVSSWDNKVYVVNLESNTVSGSIQTGTGPEKMIKTGESVWVLNQGGYSYDSIITIIDANTDENIKNLIVGDKPSGIVQDKNGNMWVMCSGNGWNGFPGADDTRGKLLCINAADYSIIKTFNFPDLDKHPEKLVINNDGEQLYYSYPGGIYMHDISEQSLELNLVYASQTMFYGLGYDPVSELIFATDPIDYVQNGMVYRIDPVTSELVGSFQGGIIPGEMYFN